MKRRAAKEIATQARGRASSLIFRIAPTAFAGTLVSLRPRLRSFSPPATAHELPVVLV
jgi:hypothetical protein